MDTDVIIVGAGAAGLAAALTLAKAGLRVLVFEGRDRVGGRVLSRPVGTAGVLAELGAEFLHGEAPETSAYLRAAGRTKIGTTDNSWLRGADGILRLDAEDFAPTAVFDRARDLTVDESVDVFLERFLGDPNLREPALRARAFVEGFEAADPAIASVRAIEREIRSGVDATTARPIGSYDPLFIALRRWCESAGVMLRLGRTVTKIAWEPGSVTIDADVGFGHTEHAHARSAIVTLPVGVLQQRWHATNVTFSPDLSKEKRAALRGLEMGHAARVVLTFRTPFWETVEHGRFRDAGFFRTEEGFFRAFWTQLPIRARTIVAWSGGPLASSFGTWTEAERSARAVDAFGDLLGVRDLARAQFEGGASHDWSSDPFACGAYSYVRVGADDARATLAAPVDATLFFAGEATATDGQAATVSGAFASGHRAAREAMRTPGSGASDGSKR